MSTYCIQAKRFEQTKPDRGIPTQFSKVNMVDTTASETTHHELFPKGRGNQMTEISGYPPDQAVKVVPTEMGQKVLREETNTTPYLYSYISDRNLPRASFNGSNRRLQVPIVALLPVELLRMIFEFYHIADGPLTHLLLVCKKWNEVAMEHQRLWGRILVAADSRPKSLTLGSTISCFGEDLLKRALTQAGSASLEATLVIGQINPNSPSANERAKRYKLVTQHSKRIKFLCIIINPCTPIHEVIESFKDVFDNADGFPVLESFMLASATPLPGLLEAFSGLLELIDRTAKKLTSVYFENVQKSFVMKTSRMGFWRELRRLTLKGEYEPLHITIFDGCHQLEFLSYSGELLSNAEDAVLPPDHALPEKHMATVTQPPNANNAPEEWRLRPVTLPALQWFRVGAITTYGLARLRTPIVRNLVIQSALRDYGGSQQPPPRSIPMNQLEVLHIATDQPCITSIHAPNLQTLCLTLQSVKRQDADFLLNSIFDGDKDMWKPTNLTIVSSAHSNHIIDSLKKSTMVENLSLTFYDPPSKELYNLLTPKRYRMPGSSGLATRLRSINFDFTPIKMDQTTREFQQLMMDQLVNSRRATTTALRVLSCKWSSNEPIRYLMGNSKICPRCEARGTGSHSTTGTSSHGG